MTAPHLSGQLADWARTAGYGLTPEDRSGAALFWSDPGGAIRYYIRATPNGGFALTSTERTLPEQFELFTSSMTTMERYLTAIFGSDYRSKNQLRRLKTPNKLEELFEGYRIRATDTDGSWGLFGLTDELVAVARGKLNSIVTLCKLSHLLQASLSDIRSSYEDPDGSPLFNK